MMSDRRTVLMAGAGVLAAASGGAWPRAQGAAPAATWREIRIWPGAAPGGSKVSVKPTVIERSKDPAVRDRAWIGITGGRPRVRYPDDRRQAGEGWPDLFVRWGARHGYFTRART